MKSHGEISQFSGAKNRLLISHFVFLQLCIKVATKLGVVKP